MSRLETTSVDTRVGLIQVQRGGPPGGDSGPIVYLHSATGEGPGLEFLELLAIGHDVIAPMFPGFGGSEGIEQIDDMEDAVFHLLDLFDVLGLTAPTIVGLSLGGWMAAELATRHPERVGRLALINPVGLYIKGAEIKDIFGRSPGAMAEDLFHDQSHPMAQVMHAFDAYSSDPARMGTLTFDMVKPIMETMAATARLGWDPYLHNPKLARRLHRISSPTIVVRAEHDTLVPAAHAMAYVVDIPRARLVELPDAAHLAPIERPVELAEIIGRFVDE